MFYVLVPCSSLAVPVLGTGTDIINVSEYVIGIVIKQCGTLLILLLSMLRLASTEGTSVTVPDVCALRSAGHEDSWKPVGA